MEAGNVPSKGEKKAAVGRDPVTGRFIKGYGGGGRKQKPSWLNGKGEDALRYAYHVMQDEEANATLRLQAARMLAEYDLGKPAQALDISADVDADARVSVIETMSLSERGRAMQAAIEAYEQGGKKG